MERIFRKKYSYLIDVNTDTFLFINEALDLSKSYTTTNEYNETLSDDFRHLANAKIPHTHNYRPYVQMFDHKYGFLENLSILDLLFMEGPNSISFLKKTYVI